VQPGIYQLTAFTRKVVYNPDQASNNIISEMIRIEVFPELDISPRELLITPNMKYTLQILGGP
jgi:hypothetical protein